MNSPKISIVAAMSKNRVIGKDNRIPWHIKEDLVRFKQKTLGHTVIIGRKTFDSLLGYYERSGRPMPAKYYIVVSRDPDYHVNRDNCFVTHSVEDALSLAKQKETDEIIIAGGEQIFKQTINLADRLYLTIVHKEIDGDAFFPDYSIFTKKIAEEKGESGEYSYTFLDLER